MSATATSTSQVIYGRRGRDPAPQVVPAGKVGVRDAAIFEAEHRPPTPEHLRPFRKCADTTVGRTIHHHGTRHNAPIDENVRFGRRGNYSITAAECLRPVVEDKIGALAAEHAEKRYQTTQREPLGRGPECPYDVPDHLKRNGFGMHTAASENAKNVIYSCGDREAPDQFPPGAQRSRRYDWAAAGVDPTKYRFGVATVGSVDHTKELLAPAETGVVLMPKVTRDVQALQQCPLGHSRALGLGTRRDVDTQEPAGKRVKTDGVDVRALLSSHGTGDDGAYERSLGKPSCRSATLRRLEASSASASSPAASSARVFGIPTVREDLPRPLFRKVTSSNNYGDDVGAGTLLYPNRYISGGVDEKYFTAPMSLEEIKKMCADCRFGLEEGTIEAVFAQVQQEDKASFEAFKDQCYALGI